MKKYSWLDGTPRQWDEQRKPHSGGGGGQTSVTTPSVAPELRPLVDLYTKQATDLANTPFQAYDQQRYADLNPTQTQGINMVTDRAVNGSPTFNNAEQNLNAMMQGGSNPYLDKAVRDAQGSVLSSAGTAGVRSGSFGNSGINEAAVKEMGNIANNMYSNNYQFDQGQRMQAIGMAPQFANQSYQDAQNLLNVGGIQQQQDQQGLDFAYNEFNRAIDDPYRKLSATGQVVGQNTGSTTTSSGGGK